MLRPATVSRMTSLRISVVGPGNNLCKDPEESEFWHIQGNGKAKAKSKESNRALTTRCGNCNLEKKKGVHNSGEHH